MQTPKWAVTLKTSSLLHSAIAPLSQRLDLPMPVVCGVAAVVSSSNHFLVNFPEVSFLFPGWHLRDKNNCLEFGSKFPNIGQAISYLWDWASFQSQFMIRDCLNLQVLPWPFDRTRVYSAPLLPFLPLLPPYLCPHANCKPRSHFHAIRARFDVELNCCALL